MGLALAFVAMTILAVVCLFGWARRTMKPRPPSHPSSTSTMTQANDGCVWQWDPDAQRWERWKPLDKKGAR